MEQYIFIHSWVQHCAAPVFQSLIFISVTETNLQGPWTTEILCCHLPVCGKEEMNPYHSSLLLVPEQDLCHTPWLRNLPVRRTKTSHLKLLCFPLVNKARAAPSCGCLGDLWRWWRLRSCGAEAGSERCFRESPTLSHWHECCSNLSDAVHQ